MMSCKTLCFISILIGQVCNRVLSRLLSLLLFHLRYLILNPRGVLHQFLQSNRVSYQAPLLPKCLLVSHRHNRLSNLQYNLLFIRLFNLQSSRIQNRLRNRLFSLLENLQVNRFVILRLFPRQGRRLDPLYNLRDFHRCSLLLNHLCSLLGNQYPIPLVLRISIPLHFLQGSHLNSHLGFLHLSLQGNLRDNLRSSRRGCLLRSHRGSRLHNRHCNLRSSH
jgi:hypothetical protein